MFIEFHLLTLAVALVFVDLALVAAGLRAAAAANALIVISLAYICMALCCRRSGVEHGCKAEGKKNCKNFHDW
jgi:hypothetical protein